MSTDALKLSIAYAASLPTDSDSVFALIWLHFDLTLNYQSIVFPFKGYSIAVLRRIAYNAYNAMVLGPTAVGVAFRSRFLRARL